MNPSEAEGLVRIDYTCPWCGQVDSNQLELPIDLACDKKVIFHCNHCQRWLKLSLVTLGEMKFDTRHGYFYLHEPSLEKSEFDFTDAKVETLVFCPGCRCQSKIEISLFQLEAAGGIVWECPECHLLFDLDQRSINGDFIEPPFLPETRNADRSWSTLKQGRSLVMSSSNPNLVEAHFCCPWCGRQMTAKLLLPGQGANPYAIYYFTCFGCQQTVGTINQNIRRGLRFSYAAHAGHGGFEIYELEVFPVEDTTELPVLGQDAPQLDDHWREEGFFQDFQSPLRRQPPLHLLSIRGPHLN